MRLSYTDWKANQHDGVTFSLSPTKSNNVSTGLAGRLKTKPVVRYEGLRVDSEDVGVPDPDPGNRHVVHVDHGTLQVSCTSCQKISNIWEIKIFFIIIFSLNVKFHVLFEFFPSCAETQW